MSLISIPAAVRARLRRWHHDMNELVEKLDRVALAGEERRVRLLEREIADAYLEDGPTTLSPTECWFLDACRHNRLYSETPDGYICAAAAAQLLEVVPSRIGQLVRKAVLCTRRDAGDSRLHYVRLADVQALAASPRKPGRKVAPK